MSRYQIRIQAIITRDMEVEAESQGKACELAHETFDPSKAESEDGYDEQIINVEKV